MIKIIVPPMYNPLLYNNNHNQNQNHNHKGEINMFEITNITKDTFATLAEGTGLAIRGATTSDEAICFNALNGNGVPVKDVIGEDIFVTDIVVTSVDVPVDRNKPEGEKVNKPCVNFFTEDGECFSSLSNGIIRATKNLLSVMSPSLESPIHIKFGTINTDKGTAHTFRLVR